MMTAFVSMNGLRIEITLTPLQMPWGSVYWMTEAHLERPILPHVFRRVGEPIWTTIEPTADAACDKLEEYITDTLA